MRKYGLMLILFFQVLSHTQAFAGGDLPFPLDQIDTYSVEKTFRCQDCPFDQIRFQFLKIKDSPRHAIRALSPEGEVLDQKSYFYQPNQNTLINFDWASNPFTIEFSLNDKKIYLISESGRFQLNLVSTVLF